MKKTLITLFMVGILGVAAFAGPTIGIGAGWAENTVFVAPSFGVQYIPNGRIGVSTTMYTALAALVTGTDFAMALGGFWEIAALTVPVADLSLPWKCKVTPCAVDGIMKLSAGIGTPFWLASDGDAMALEGFDLGVTVGLAVENIWGSGLKLLGYFNGDTVGVGLTFYYDLATPYRD